MELTRVGGATTAAIGEPWTEFHKQIKALVEADLNNEDEEGAWKVIKYQDGVQVSAYKPKYALNFCLDVGELKTYLAYFTLMCSVFTFVNYLVSWEMESSWLGFCLAFLNYEKLGKVFGIKSPEKTLIKARIVLDGNPAQLAQAFTDTHCDLQDFVGPSSATKPDEAGQALGHRLRIQQFLMTLQSIDLSPFWLGIRHLLRKINITNRTLEGGNFSSPGQSYEAILKSGTPGMKHVSFRDERNNYFVLKKAKKEANQMQFTQQDNNSIGPPAAAAADLSDEHLSNGNDNGCDKN